MRERLPAAAAALVILSVGLAVRALTGGALAKYAGVALYAVLVFVLILLVAPRLATWVTATAALSFCWAVEFAQQTPVPAALSARSTLARLVLGSTFNPPDLLWYAVGVAVGAAVLALTRRATVHSPCVSDRDGPSRCA